jgi:hypothetical protein
MLQAYSNKQAVKTLYIDRFDQHVKADNLIRGDYKVPVNNHFRGCAITCMLNDPKTEYSELIIRHSAFETEPIRFPEWLGLLIDSFHEKTSSIEFSQDFQVRLLKSVPVGFTDWQTIKSKFLIFVLEDCKAHNPEPVQRVIDLLNREIAGDSPTEDEWSAASTAASTAADSAWSAARSSAGSAADSAWAAADSAWAVAECAAGRVNSAAECAASVASSAAESAWSAAMDRYANHLVELFQSA